MEISIFGIGYVGVVSGACLASFGHKVIGVDILPEKVAALGCGQSPIVEPGVDRLIAAARAAGRLDATDNAIEAVLGTELSFVCVGTPSDAGGAAGLNAVESVITAIASALREKKTPHTVVMRSTVPPGTAESRLIPLLQEGSGRRIGEGLDYYANPEFMREGSAVRDFSTPPFTLIGAADGNEGNLLREIYAPLNAPIQVCSYRVAESIKYISNIFHALKLSFANEAGSILAAYGVDAREVFRVFCDDHILNISPAYLRPGFAFGGSCLPKDMRSFLALARERHIPAPLLNQVLPSNDSILERTYLKITQYGRQTIALFGLAFKENTDDLRESPFVKLAERLIGKGFDLRIFDRSVEVSRLMGKNRAYIGAEIPHLGRLLVTNPAEAVQQSGIVVIGHISKDDLAELGRALSNQIVIDLLGVPQLKEIPGIAYKGICW